MSVRGLLASLTFVAALFTSPVSAQADPDINGQPTSDGFSLVGNDAEGGTLQAGDQDVSDARSDVEYKWLSACSALPTTEPGAGPTDCARARFCALPDQRLWVLWSREPGQPWKMSTTRCFSQAPGARLPQVTPGLVLNALRRIGLPRHEVRTQPAGKTLVNFDTIFYTHATPYTRTLTLLGQRVQVVATPTSYTWHHGDGTTATTSTPGAPYPAMDITHDYAHAHTTVQPSVDTTYTARYRVNNGPWQTIPQTVTITGPTTNLRIAEATPVLSGDYQ